MPRTVVIDEFPFLVKASPSLPSIIQRELGPGGSGQESAARLLLCGSAMSVMGGLLAGQAPLRGRASLELLIRPFDYTCHPILGADDPAGRAPHFGGTLYRRGLVALDTRRRRRHHHGSQDRVNPPRPWFAWRDILAEETNPDPSCTIRAR